MSDTTATSASATGNEWLELPRLAWRLLVRFWPALLFWFFAQRFAYLLLLPAAVRMGFVNHMLGFLGLSLNVVAQLLCTIGMFDALRPGMAAFQSAPSEADSGQRFGSRFGAILAIALLPFFAYYASWGLLADTIRAYILEFMQTGSAAQRNGLPTDLLHTRGLWLSVALTWVLRRLLLWWHKLHPSLLWSVLATICQAFWVFLGLYVIKHWTDSLSMWGQQRVAWKWLTSWWDTPAGAAAPDVSGPALPPHWIDAVQQLLQSMLLPLAWFAIAAIVYGRDLRKLRLLSRSHARFELARRRVATLPLPVRDGLDKIADKISAGWNSKGLPVVNGLRLLLGAGLGCALALCVCYVALDVACNLMWRVVATVIGAHDIHVWDVFSSPLTMVFNGPLDLQPSLLAEPARICLLAAAVDIALRRVRRVAATAPLSDAENADIAADASTG